MNTDFVFIYAQKSSGHLRNNNIGNYDMFAVVALDEKNPNTIITPRPLPVETQMTSILVPPLSPVLNIDADFNFCIGC